MNSTSSIIGGSVGCRCSSHCFRRYCAGPTSTLSWNNLHLTFMSRWSNNLWLRKFLFCSSSLHERFQISSDTAMFLPFHSSNLHTNCKYSIFKKKISLHVYNTANFSTNPYAVTNCNPLLTLVNHTIAGWLAFCSVPVRQWRATGLVAGRQAAVRPCPCACLCPGGSTPAGWRVEPASQSPCGGAGAGVRPCLCLAAYHERGAGLRAWGLRPRGNKRSWPGGGEAQGWHLAGGGRQWSR